MIKIFVSFATFGLLTLLTSGVVNADPKNCQPIFGGGETCVQSQNFTLDKRIQDPRNQNFVDNLGTDVPYAAGQTINFAITVKNISRNAITGLKVTDTFPQFVDFAEGNGTYNEEDRTLTFTIDRLNADESKTYIVKARVVSQADLPQNGTSCVANLVQAQVRDDLGADNVQFCLTPAARTNQGQTQATPAPIQPAQTKGGQPVHQAPKTQTSPATGPEVLSLIALLPSGVAGFLLRRKIVRG